MSGLTPLLTSGYENISHGFVCAMTERWHEETSNFHLPVGEMTITLDDADLLFTEEDAAKELTRQGTPHISFGALKRRYEEFLNRCNQLLVPDTQEELDERAEVRLACIKYSRWIMADSDIMVRHLPERFLRQYRYVQTIPLPPTDIELLAADDVAQTFTEFALHVLSHQLRGHPVMDNQSWAHTKGYMRWFIRVSHPTVNPLRPQWATVGHTSSQHIPDHRQHQSQSGKCNGAS
uniref:IMP dehydrogenase/GMP reductase, related n=1 Tax=Medicago truncatula TaxID=3880 RepID=Q1RU84_MEDTR|nr:IMP dehydrogenase/GMP reductase, related [Medicago truncatula]